MKKPLKIALIAAAAILILGVAYIFGLLSQLNYIFYRPVDTSCNADSDCVLRQTTCSVRCACPTAVNKDWDLKCPFGYEHPFAMCEVCSFNFNLRCINNTCRQIFNRSAVLGIMK